MHMIEDVRCPYCGAKQDIDHEDGYGYEEDKIYNQECPECGKTFAYNTYISFDYDVWKSDCLNGGEHKWEFSISYPKQFSTMFCPNCGERRQLTEEEKIKFNVK